jgi:Fe2+ transport system protein B
MEIRNIKILFKEDRMKSEKIKKELETLDSKLKEKIVDIGASESAGIVELKQSDLSAWVNGKRNWTWNKVLKIAERIGL